MAIKLYPHNEKTYKKMTTMFKKDNRVGVVQPTGTGKSYLILKWIEDHPKEKFVVLSPSEDIFAQMKGYAMEAGEEALLDAVEPLTYQMLIRMTDEKIRNTYAQKIVVDEFHRTGAKLWGPVLLKLLEANPNAKVLGTSATPVRYLDGGRDMASELFDRNLAVERTLGEAVLLGILAMPKIVEILYDIDDKISVIETAIAQEADAKKRKKAEKLLARAKRHLGQAEGVEIVFQKYMPHDHGKFIVFCRNKEHLEEMMKTVPKWLRFVNKKVRSYVSIADQADKDVQLWTFVGDNGTDAIKLLFTIDRLNEGLHAKGIDGVIMLRPTESPIIYLQQMGRALAAGNKSPIIFDMVNNCENVKVHMSNGEMRNVIEAQFLEAGGSESDIPKMRIMGAVRDFNQMMRQLDGLLYPSNDAIWGNNFEAYVSYKKEFGKEPAVNTVYKETSLGNWCRTQREIFKKGMLADERIERLRDAGFVFDVHDAEWQRIFNLCVSYKKEYNCLPNSRSIYQGEKFGNWFSRQRLEFQNGNLSDEKTLKLQSIGFVFTPVNDYKWQRNLDLYINYKKEFGCEPVQATVYRGRWIGVWQLRQKKEFAAGRLSQEQIKKLQEAKFIFDPEFAEWCRKLDLYIAFQKKYNCNPHTKTDYQGENLTWWYDAQKKAFFAGTLSEEKLQMLYAAGFVFETRKNKEDKMWQNKFDLYVAYKKEFGKEPAQKTIYNGVGLGIWCNKQRQRYKNNKLSNERIQKLRDAGFPLEPPTRAPQQ